METMHLIKVATVRLGAARIEGRAPSHDGEYLTVIRLGKDSWFATGNGGIACGSDWFEGDDISPSLLAEGWDFANSEGDWFEGDDIFPSFDELAEAASNATEGWDFANNPDQYGFEARDHVQEWLAAGYARLLVEGR